MAACVAEERASERAGRAGRSGGGRARLRSALAGGAAMLAGRCVSGSGAGARCGPGLPRREGRGLEQRRWLRGRPRPRPSAALCLGASLATRPSARARPGGRRCPHTGVPAPRGGRAAFPPLPVSQFPQTSLIKLPRAASGAAPGASLAFGGSSPGVGWQRWHGGGWPLMSLGTEARTLIPLRPGGLGAPFCTPR